MTSRGATVRVRLGQVRQGQVETLHLVNYFVSIKITYVLVYLLDDQISETKNNKQTIM